jgi:hypothetical protein
MTRNLLIVPNSRGAFSHIHHICHPEGHPKKIHIIAGLPNGPYNTMSNKDKILWALLSTSNPTKASK